jgi:hypothetical protein
VVFEHQESLPELQIMKDLRNSDNNSLPDIEEMESPQHDQTELAEHKKNQVLRAELKTVPMWIYIFLRTRTLLFQAFMKNQI